jgi:general secretion pathway protein G
MKILAIYRPTARAERRRVRLAHGFTLLELLVVLTLIAAMTGLVLPQLSRLYDSGQRAFQRKQVIDDIAALPYLAFTQQRGFTLDAAAVSASDAPLSLPEGWTLEVQEPAGISYRSNGYCSGGELQLFYDELVETVTLEPPLCQPGE